MAACAIWPTASYAWSAKAFASGGSWSASLPGWYSRTASTSPLRRLPAAAAAAVAGARALLGARRPAPWRAFYPGAERSLAAIRGLAPRWSAGTVRLSRCPHRRPPPDRRGGRLGGCIGGHPGLSRAHDRRDPPTRRLADPPPRRRSGLRGLRPHPGQLRRPLGGPGRGQHHAGAATPRIELVQGAHLVLDQPRIEHCYYLEVPEDGRALFLLPWQGRTLLGTTETPLRAIPTVSP